MAFVAYDQRGPLAEVGSSEKWLALGALAKALGGPDLRLSPHRWGGPPAVLGEQLAPWKGGGWSAGDRAVPARRKGCME